MALIDIPYVKSGSLGIPINDPSLDTQLALWIAEAGARIASECNQEIEQTTHTNVTFNGNGLTRRTFGYFPVTAVASLQHKSGIGSAATWTTIPDTAYELVTGDGYYLHYPEGFTRGVANYRMTFTHGYAPNAIPEDIRGVARAMVTKCVTDYPGSGGRGEFGKSSVSYGPPTGGTLNTVIKDLEPAWSRILSGYTVFNVRRG